MIRIVLSERDFDYELQALINSFFPGQRSTVWIRSEMTKEIIKEMEESLLNKEDLQIEISFEWLKVSVKMISGNLISEKEATVSGEEDWHKHDGKTAHPYRTYYKNVLKRMVFKALSEFPKESLPKTVERRIPEWGTMTGVRPTKITMNEILAGKTEDEARNELASVYCCSKEKIDLSMEIATTEAKLLKEADYENGYSLYIGIPFCPTTCLYCSFTSYPYEKFGHLAERYLQTLKKEISYAAGVYGRKKLTSIYIGGGTPTTLTAEQLRELLQCVREHFPMKDSYEFTVEAGRPDSISREKLQALREFDVERISVNPQTMQQKTLDLIGRRHTVEQTKEAFFMARELGFTNINMDLIIGLPGETVEDFKDTLSQIKELNPDSITIHSLVIKRGSRLRTVLEESGAYEEEENLRAVQMEQMLKFGQQFAKEQGYAPYYMYRQKNSAGHMGSSGQENIGFARKGKECLYNILIMEEKQTILAVGAGASTKIYHENLGQVSRIENVKSVIDYIERIDEMIDRKRNAFEELFDKYGKLFEQGDGK